MSGQRLPAFPPRYLVCVNDAPPRRCEEEDRLVKNEPDSPACTTGRMEVQLLRGTARRKQTLTGSKVMAAFRANTGKWFCRLLERATFLATSVRNCLLSHVHSSTLEWSLCLTVSPLTDCLYDNRGRSLSIPHTYEDI